MTIHEFRKIKSISFDVKEDCDVPDNCITLNVKAVNQIQHNLGIYNEVHLSNDSSYFVKDLQDLLDDLFTEYNSWFLDSADENLFRISY